uniref:Refilin B n=1 Tax=Pseudonaja textilis TaxID=8673 RepID=A0A670YG88_PSETE
PISKLPQLKNPGLVAANNLGQIWASPTGNLQKFKDLLVLVVLQESSSSSPNPLRLCPLSFGEGVAFDPLPPKDVRYTSSVKYDSEKHFINNIYMPVRLGVSSCSQTIICVPDSTWRSYKAEVQFHLCNRPGNFKSTTIVYPKHTKTVYTTTLDYNCKKFNRKFLSSVELESSGNENVPESS